MPKLHKGFTLIELLVVITIIAVLASISIITFVGVQQKGRDGVRKADVRTVQSSLRTYYNDIGKYPDNNGNFEIMGCGSAPLCNTACAWGSAWTCGTQTYMNRLPADPIANNYRYAKNSDDDYVLAACFENANDAQASVLPAWCPTGKGLVAKP